jgi:hypothetical protein
MTPVFALAFIFSCYKENQSKYSLLNLLFKGLTKRKAEKRVAKALGEVKKQEIDT